MCGIVGTYRPEGAVTDEATLTLMRDSMAHRGPDGVGFGVRRRPLLCFGHRRLSIIDLSEAAAQPMVTDGGAFLVVFNGEVYNHAELTTTSSSVRPTVEDRPLRHRGAAAGLEQVGDVAQLDLYGMFAFAIYDGGPGQPTLHL